jgi:hypothetical protein
LETRKAKQVLSARSSGEKGGKSVKILQMLYTHVCNWKNEICETIPGMRVGENEGKWWRG